MTDRISEAALRRAPKVVLHDHLDGGLRPATVIELAADAGHTLPTTDAGDLRAWCWIVR
jgi:adenosine deaminase